MGYALSMQWSKIKETMSADEVKERINNDIKEMEKLHRQKKRELKANYEDAIRQKEKQKKEEAEIEAKGNKKVT